MDIQTRIKTDLAAAMKAGEKDRTSVLRMMLSEIKYGATAKKSVPAEQCVLSYRKKIADAIAESAESAKPTLEAELTVVDEYCPKMPTEGEILAAIKAQDLSQHFGLIIKAVKAQYPLADGKLVSDLVQKAKASPS